MKRSLDAPPPRSFVPNCSGQPAAEAWLQRLIAGMAHVDTSEEEACVGRFQSDAIIPDPRTNADDAQLVLRWCAENGLGDQFRAVAKTYGAPAHGPEVDSLLESVDLTFDGIAPQYLDFFIATLTRCPQLKGIDLPIPATREQAKRLAEALACNSCLKRLQLHVSEKAPPDSTVLQGLFSHHTARVDPLSEVRIDIKDEPAGDTDWMMALRDALSTHLKAESAHLTLPWTNGRLKLLGDAIRTSPCLSSLTLGGNLTGFGALQLLNALKNSGGQLESLSFLGSFDEALIDTMIATVGYIPSLTRVYLGNTPTPEQKKSLTTMLERHWKNIERWRYLTGSEWV